MCCLGLILVRGWLAVVLGVLHWQPGRQRASDNQGVVGLMERSFGVGSVGIVELALRKARRSFDLADLVPLDS